SDAPTRLAVPSSAQSARPSSDSASPRCRRAQRPCADSARSTQTRRLPDAAASRDSPWPDHAAAPVLPVLLAQVEHVEVGQRLPAVEVPPEVQVVFPGRLRRAERDPEPIPEQLEV